MGIRHDNDLGEAEWADLRRAIRSLFRVVYGATPRISHRLVRSDLRRGHDRWHAVSLTAPKTFGRNAVEFCIQASCKVRCYLSIIEGLYEKLRDSRYDVDQDDWVIETTSSGERATSSSLPPGADRKVLWLEKCPLFPHPQEGEPAIRNQSFKYVRRGLEPGYIRVQKAFDGVLVPCKYYRFDWRTFDRPQLARHWGEGIYNLDLMSTAESNHGESARMLTRTITIGEDEGAKGLPLPSSLSAWRDAVPLARPTDTAAAAEGKEGALDALSE